MYKFKGKPDQFINGAPNRDMTEEEFNALPEEVRKTCIASGLYVKSGEEKPAKVEKEK